jgi:DNA-binding CsgD family transcriptional regulator/phosphoserine phosphatase
MSPTRVPALVERDGQASAIRAAIQSAQRGSGRTVLITGEAGIGKTALLRETLDEQPNGPAGEGMRVVRAQGRELEQQYPYGVVLQLFEKTVAQHRDIDLLAGAASLASLLFRRDEPAGTDAPAEPFPILHGLFWLVANLAERGPMVLAVDDAHWADLASLRFLHYLAQRLADLPVCLLLTVRPERSWPAELRQIAEIPASQQVRLSELSLAAVQQLMAAEGLPATDALAQTVWQATGGNPFFISQVLRHMSADEARTMRIVAPETLTRRVLGRVERAGDVARRVAEALAVLGGSARLRAIADLAGVDLTPATDAIGMLADRGIVQINGQVSFIHPIVQAAVYESIDRMRRGELHRIAARSVAADPAELDAAAIHLLSVPPMSDAWVVDLLEVAAQRAMERAAPETAIDYLRRAIEEPPVQDRRVDLLVQLARSHTTKGDGIEAVACFSRALGLSESARERASVLYELGQARLVSAQWKAAAGDFERGLQELASVGVDDTAQDPLAAELEAGSIAAGLIAMQPGEHIERRVAKMLAAPDLAPGARQLAASAAFQAATQGRTTAAEQVELGMTALRGETTERLLVTGQAIELVAGVLLAADELELDRAILTDAIEVAQRTGQYAKFCSLSYCRAGPNIWTGRLAEGVADAQVAVGGVDRGWETFFPAASAALSLALLERDELDAAAAALDIDDARWSVQLDYQVMTVGARGRLAEARGDLAAALNAYRSVERVCTSLGLRNSDTILPFRGLLAVLLARSGDRAARAEADALVAEDLAVAAQWDTARYRGIALRATGLVEGGVRGIELLRESVELLEKSQSVIERLRTMLSLGAALRRAGQLTEARELLRRTLDAAHRCGARLIERQAAEELRLAGARPRRYELTGVGALTPAELRVASMAAAGRSNRDVAQALFDTTKAVEYHLGNAYRKLGIATRGELPRALGAD